jgi:uncharacterized membrane protein YqjE
MVTATEQQRSLDQPSVVGSVERMFDAGQRLLIERIDLARLEAQDAIGRALWTALFVIAGATLAFTGWLALMAVMVLALRDYAGLPTAMSILIVGAAHAILGGALVIYGISSSKSSEHAEARA